MIIIATMLRLIRKSPSFAAVKIKIKIVVGVLGMYLFSLSLFLFFHSQTHTQNIANTVQNNFDDITIKDNSDCQICSFYFNQQLFVEKSLVYQLDFSTYYFHQNLIETLFVVLQEQQHKRGPPVF